MKIGRRAIVGVMIVWVVGGSGVAFAESLSFGARCRLWLSSIFPVRERTIADNAKNVISANFPRLMVEPIYREARLALISMWSDFPRFRRDGLIRSLRVQFENQERMVFPSALIEFLALYPTVMQLEDVQATLGTPRFGLDHYDSERDRWTMSETAWDQTAWETIRRQAFALPDGSINFAVVARYNAVKLKLAIEHPGEPDLSNGIMRIPQNRLMLAVDKVTGAIVAFPSGEYSANWVNPVQFSLVSRVGDGRDILASPPVQELHFVTQNPVPPAIERILRRSVPGSTRIRREVYFRSLN